MSDTPLKIAILGPRTPCYDLLTHFIEHNCQFGLLVEPEQADVCILNLDGFDAERLLHDHRQRNSGQPMIVLALNKPAQEGCIWVKKPLQSRQLMDALETVRHLNGKNDSAALKVVRNTDETTALNQAARQLASKHRANHKAVHTVSVSKTKYYEPVEYLQGILIKAYRQAVTTGISLRIDTGWEPIFIYPHKRLVWVDADDKKLQAFCHLSIRKFSHLTGELASGPTITPEPGGDIDKPPDGCQSMEAFLWKVSWWNSAGRLPRGVKSSQLVRLKRWPNLTRLWCPASALQVASLLYQTAKSPEDAVTALALPPADVYSFISAARATGLIERVEEKRSGPPSNLPAEKERRFDRRPRPEPARSSGGFLRKILRSLRGE